MLIDRLKLDLPSLPPVVYDRHWQRRGSGGGPGEEEKSGTGEEMERRWSGSSEGTKWGKSEASLGRVGFVV